MKDVWTLPAIAPWEKSCGQHPTQKPLSVLTRIILASTRKGAWIIDPFSGASTTGIAANILERKYLGIDIEEEYLELSKKRKQEIENQQVIDKFKNKIKDFKKENQLDLFLFKEPNQKYDVDLKL
jgi:site-specific DNA-methyltransferase (adenine-specific)